MDVPTLVAHAIEIDRRNGNRMCQDAIKKVMTNVGVAFDILPPEKIAPVGYSKVSGHLVFDVKMDFTWKAQWVKDGLKKADPLGSNYADVVSRDTVFIAFTYAALNDVDVCTADVMNTYIQATLLEEYYIICGPEFGANKGCIAVIIRSSYDGRCAGRDYWLHLHLCVKFLGFTPCKADSDLWMRLAKKEDN